LNSLSEISSIAVSLVFVTVELLNYRGVMLFVFHISYIYTVEFADLGLCHWLEMLVPCSLSVNIFSMFWQDIIVAGLRYYLLLLGCGCGTVTKHCPHTQGTGPDPQSCLN
jgi:hypothetical protein